ncbi:Phytanoyl-CoA dioxygenase, peroxisomal [Hondaea fermentalgiana]|uniref:Phytanoyl-CoA dioxygenase, peroxisomal n=1 Tax=Hondaea fermentalgiana TaxID=2315210 RepID=A0A2R5G6J2_9STRA|nr:Phytanoyl-CoA dioxygenase, peroxisomal [Hondaea fermentalgiana]|eukprot:GBG24053.1 Phytanoyl-CoA dioxygenase, peroxisomal [Hondaea fermentalgiana]
MKLDHAPLGIRKSLGWTKCFVGSFKTMQLAHRAVEEAMAKRDRGLIGVAPRPHPELCTSMQQTDLLLTHLEVRVESNNLASFNYSDKMAYVWHLLLYHCAVLDAFKMSESFHRVCKFTYIGPNVRALSVFTRLPLVASVSVKDQGRRRRPSAPLELSEKMRRRVGKDQSSIAQHRKRPATIKEMKKLVEDSGSDDEEDRAQGKRRFGHFFKGLSQDAQNLASQEALREEHRAIRDRTRRTPSSKPSRESKSTPSSDAPTRRRAVFSMRETSKEPIQMSMWVHRQEMRSAAIKLQRIFRGRAGPRIIRQEFRAEWHAIMAQRFVRGWIGRRRAEEWRILANSAAECVQRFWYMTLAQRRVRKIRRERVRLVLLLQPLVRGMMARKILAWRKRYDWAAKRIQSVMRGHRDRALFKRMLARKFHEDTVVPAAITIQRVGRGMLDRRVARMLRYEKHYAEVIVPSSIILQNLWRARVAQKRVAELRAQRFACTMLQRIIRGRLERKRFVGIVEWNARQQAATKIASVIRGWMAREICDWRRREHRRQFVEEPAAGQIQAAWRGLQTRRWFRHYAMKDAAVLVLQRTWRRVLARRKAREALDEMARAYMSKLATRLQAAFRGFRGRRRFRSLAQERDAQRLWATVVIQRQWRAVVRRAEKRRRREEIAREMHFLDLELLDIDVEEIQNDIKDVEEERHRILQYVRKSSKYRRKLKAARTEMEYRLPELELELNKLDLDDEETIPWQEAFESEIDQLSNILAMSEQELESKKLQVADMEEDAAELLMEIEDLQLDLEDTLQRRNTLIDEHRVRELRSCAKAYRCDRENRIRTQRSRWKPKDVRRKIIARFRAEALPPLPPDVLHTSRMMLDRVASISVKKRQAYRRRDETTAQRLAFERQLTEMETRGVKEDALVRATYDGAVDGAKRVLQEYTYELRRPKHDIRADPRREHSKAKNQTRTGQAWPLKMEAIAALFAEAGSRDYVGEAVSQEAHALQCAKFAADAGADEEVVLAALLHDVGHLLGMVDPTVKQMEGNLGTVDHERLGASWLVTLGFPPRTVKLVRHHVDAKRYLCWKNPAYHNKLSEASKGTLLQQGGVMSDEEAAAFAQDPLMETILKMRTWDEAAKIVNPSFEVPPLDAYREMIERVIAQRRAALASKSFTHYKLSEAQLDAWNRDGYIKLSDLLSPALKQQVVAWTEEIQGWNEAPGKHMCYYERQTAADGRGADALMLCRTENFLPFHEGLRKLLAEEGPIMDVLEQLMNEPAVLFKEKINYKLSGGGGFPAHQDAPAFTSFGQRNHLTVNIAIDAATRENGCLEAAPGHHRAGLFPQDPVHRGLSAESEASLGNWADLLLDVGDVLIFSSWLPHRSGANRSDAARRALYITYNGETDGEYREQYYALKRKEFPQQCEREPGKDYSKGAETFNIATPIVS